MDVLVDTNVLLRSIDQTHRQHAEAADATDLLHARGDRPCVASQNVVELRAVCTRPVVANGLGMSQAGADEEVRRLHALFHVLPDHPAVLTVWEHLATTYVAEGRQNYDARIVAAMVVYGVPAILTFDVEDFARYPHVRVLTPRSLLG